MSQPRQKPEKFMGKKKGGTMFPRINLEQAIKYSFKLVSKTHTGAQPPATLFRGVFGAGGSRASIRSSALKQYGLMEGSDKDGYRATALAVGISTSPLEERTALFRTACLKPKVFGVLFDTYHGDDVSIAKLRQQAATVKVHPDELDNCAEIFLASVAYAELGSRIGDSVQLVASRDVTMQREGIIAEDRDQQREYEEVNPGASAQASRPDGEDGKEVEHSETSDVAPKDTRSRRDTNVAPQGMTTGRAVIQVNVTLDSSLDTEKLEKQLSLLRRFGAL